MATFKTFVLTAAIDGDVNTDTLADELERIIEYARQHHSLSSDLDAIESLLAENERLNAELAKYRDAPVVAWVEVIDSYEGPYHFHGQKLLGVGKHKLIVKPDENK